MIDDRLHPCRGDSGKGDRVIAIRSRFLTLVFDALILAFLAIWLSGGIFWGERLFLKHGADPRRAALILALLGAGLFSSLRGKSMVLRFAVAFGQKLLLPQWRWGSLIAIFLWALVLGVLQTLAFRYPLYDVGIFHQILWSLAHGHGFVSTVSGAGNFLRDHLSPSLAVLAPVYWLTGSAPWILPVIHAALVFSGVAAWVFLAERLPGASVEFRKILAAGTLVFAMSFDSLWGNLRWGFHENSLWFAGMSWVLALCLAEGWRRGFFRNLLVVVLFFIAAGSKEILLLNAAMAVMVWVMLGGGINALLSKQMSKQMRPSFLPGWSQWVMGALIALSLIVVFIAFEAMPHPAEKNYFNRYYSYFGGDLRSFFNGVFFTPWKISESVGVGNILIYIKDVFLPWLGLPLAFWLLGYQSLVGLIIFPSFASAALATYQPLREAGFHYVLELWPVLAVLTLVALGRLSKTKIVWAWALLSLLLMDQDPWGQMREFYHGASAQTAVRARLHEIPLQESIAADELAGTWVSGRLSVTRWPDLSVFPMQCPDWLILREQDIPSAVSLRCAKKENLSPTWSIAEWRAYRLL